MVADIRASFAGEYEDLQLGTSPVVRDGEIVAAIMIVHRASWNDVPKCSFIIELFTDRTQRRRRLGRALLAACFTAVRNGEGTSVTLQVDAGNRPARFLYDSMAFSVWVGVVQF